MRGEFIHPSGDHGPLESNDEDAGRILPANGPCPTYWQELPHEHLRSVTFLRILGTIAGGRSRGRLAQYRDAPVRNPTEVGLKAWYKHEWRPVTAAYLKRSRLSKRASRFKQLMARRDHRCSIYELRGEE